MSNDIRNEILKEVNDSSNWGAVLFKKVWQNIAVFHDIRKVLPHDTYTAFDKAYCKYVRVHLKELESELEVTLDHLPNERRPATSEESNYIYKQMQQAEKNGTFDNMFTLLDGDMPIIPVNKDQLLASINPQMKLCKGFFKRIYGYTITDPTFKDIALHKLEELGCSKAQEYYNTTVQEIEQVYKENMKNVAEQYARECEGNFKNMEKKEVKNCNIQKAKIIADLQKKNDKELLNSLQKLKQDGLL